MSQLPNLSGPVARWSAPRVLKSEVITTVDFVETKTVTLIPGVSAMIQVADKTKLNPASIDWSRDYILVHSLSPLPLGTFIEYRGEDFKLVSGGGNWSDYGYHEVVAEQTKLPLKVPT